MRIAIVVAAVLMLCLIGAFSCGGTSMGGSGNPVEMLLTMTIPEAVQRYKADTGGYPPDLAALVADPGCSGWGGSYMKAVQLRDPWGGMIEYQRDGDSYELTVTVPPDVQNFRFFPKTIRYRHP